MPGAGRLAWSAIIMGGRFYPDTVTWRLFVVVAACREVPGEMMLLRLCLLQAAANFSACVMPARGCLLGAVVHPTLIERALEYRSAEDQF